MQLYRAAKSVVERQVPRQILELRSGSPVSLANVQHCRLQRVRTAVMSVTTCSSQHWPTTRSGIRVVSRNEDPQQADAAARTLALAMSSVESHCAIWCKDPKDYYNDWWATVYNYQLRMPDQRFVHALNDNACVAYAYWYPDQKPAVREGDKSVPEPEGSVDTSSWERPEGVLKATRMLDHIAACASDFSQDHGTFLYIAFLGVHPDQHGKGLASKMLTYLCDECDRRGRWAYLEASNSDNARLYKRFGFESLGRDITTALPDLVPGVALTLTPMGRRPRNPPPEGA